MNIKDFIKRYKVYFLFCFLLVVFALGSTCIMNKIVYGEYFIKISPFFTIKRLLYMVERVKRKDKIIKALCVYFLPHLMIFLSLIAILLKKIRDIGFRGGKGDEEKRKTIKGSSHWGTLKDLKKRGYLYTRKHLPSVIFGQSVDAVVYAPNTFIQMTKKKGKYIIGCEVSKKKGKTPTVNHTLILGATRSGKGISTIIPTLLSYEGSVIVYDPACENYTLTGEYRKRQGKVLYFHPQDKNSTLKFNPLDWINRDKFQILMSINSICQLLVVNTDPKAKFFDDSARDFVKVFIEYVLLFYPYHKQNLYEVANISKVLKEEDMFSSSNLLKRIAENEEKIRETSDEKQREILEKVVAKLQIKMREKEGQEKTRERLIDERLKEEVLYGSEKSRDEIIKIVKKERPDLFKGESGEGLLAFVEKLSYDIQTEKELLLKEDVSSGWRFILLENAGATLQTLKTFGAMKSEQTMGSIMQTVSTALQFYQDENLRELMDTSSFTKEDLTMKEESLSLYLNIPNDLTEHFKTYVKLFVSLITSALTSGSDLKDGSFDQSTYYKKYGKHTVLFILDEFPQLGKMESVEMMIPFIGKFGAAFMLIAQSLPQLEKAYGKEGALGMIDNMQLVNIKKVGLNMETKEWVSKNLGSETVMLRNNSSSLPDNGSSGSISTSMREEQRSLLDPCEVGTLPDSEQLLLIPGASPVKLKKIQWYTEEIFLERVNGGGSNKRDDKKSEIKIDNKESGGFSPLFSLPDGEKEQNVDGENSEKEKKINNEKETEREKDKEEECEIKETLNLPVIDGGSLFEELSLDDMLSLPYVNEFADDFVHTEENTEDDDTFSTVEF